MQVSDMAGEYPDQRQWAHDGSPERFRATLQLLMPVAA
jgi:hypothetical protein